MKKLKVSVAMASYNGQKYIKEQIDSILNQTHPIDELIISDDGSSDKTLDIIKKYKDKRIKVIKGPQKGVKQNFANAIKETSGDLIFLADQDDIWNKKKVSKVIREMKNDKTTTLIVHDAEVFDSDSKEIVHRSFYKYRNSGNGVLKNIYKNTYIGCCMAFKKELKEHILPIPNNIEMHDQWIGIVNEKKLGKSKFINDNLLKYRRHSDNVSSMNHYQIKKMIKNRLILISEIMRLER